jgi:hypothetical protein
VTAAPDNGAMVGPLAERTGVLVVRAWVEGEAPQAFRARLTRSLDVSSLDEVESTAASIDEVCEQVRVWLLAFVGR